MPPPIPPPVLLTPYLLAQRYVGVRELFGDKDHPLVQWWLSLCHYNLDAPDEIPWCAAFVNGMCWELRLQRSKSAAARSWLNVGIPINLIDAEPGFDVVIFKRGKAPQPGPEVIAAPGHVGFYAGRDLGTGNILILGGNQGDSVSIQQFPALDVLGVRRLTA